MKYLSFELTMPNVGSWNGKWSGADNKYYLIKKVTDRRYKEIGETLVRNSWYYNFGDGWGASVGLEIVDSKEATKRQKISKGFCGYEWMVDSIMQCGKIKIIENEIS